MSNEHTYLYETKINIESARFERAEHEDRLHFLPLSTGVAAAALLDTADPDVIYCGACGVEVFSHRNPRRPVANAAQVLTEAFP